MKIEWGSQMTIDEWLADSNNQNKNNVYKIRKPIRAISIFAGIGAQIAALKRLDYPVEDYKISEWDVNAVKQYNAMHFQDDTDYSKGISIDKIIDYLDNKGCSLDGKDSLPKEKMIKKGEKWIRETYNNYIATHNMGSILQMKGG